MCGSLMKDHNVWSGHSATSMYDYAVNAPDLYKITQDSKSGESMRFGRLFKWKEKSNGDASIR